MLLGMVHDVLVVEDEEDIAVPLMRTLEREGYDVSRVSGGADAVSFVVDLSVSKVARGNILAAKQRNQPIPEGWALDAEGNATTDPAAALAGTMIPFGDAKGAALALMVEILSACLVGANLSAEATNFFDGEGPPPGVGQ